MIKEIIEILLKNISEKEKMPIRALLSNDYEISEFSTDNYIQIKESSENNNICFVDGGNTEIIKAADFSLQFIRICKLFYQNNKYNKKTIYEYYCLIETLNKKGIIFYSVKLFPVSCDKLIDDFEINSSMFGEHVSEISKIGNFARTLLENAICISELNNEQILIKDGSLDTHSKKEEEFINEIINNNQTICALSKTSRIFCESRLNIFSQLNNKAPKGTWYYKIASSKKGDIYAVKLNKNSKFVFRLDILNNKNINIDSIMSKIASNSNDPVFKGYPFGLIMVDKFARVSNSESEYLKNTFMHKLKNNYEKIQQHQNTLSAHDILDKIS